jgi:hypothetical protein
MFFVRWRAQCCGAKFAPFGEMGIVPARIRHPAAFDGMTSAAI